jgi:hypothetical protein
MSTDPRVAAELARLAGATDRRLREHDRASAGRRRQWYRERFADRPVPGQGPLEQAYRLLLARLGIGEEDAPIVERGPDRYCEEIIELRPTDTASAGAAGWTGTPARRPPRPAGS